MAVRGAGRGLWIILALVALALVAGVTGLTLTVLARPDQAGAAPPDPEAGRRFQSVLAQLLLRDTGLSSRQDPLILTTADVNGFLAGHVEVRDPPVWPVRVRIEADGIELGGATTLGRLVEAGLGAQLGQALLGLVGDRPVWVAASGQIVVRGSRAEFLVHAATIGRQRVPVVMLWRLLGGRPPALAWRMPRVVERVDVEPGRLLIHTRRVGRGRGSPG